MSSSLGQQAGISHHALDLAVDERLWDWLRVLAFKAKHESNQHILRANHWYSVLHVDPFILSEPSGRAEWEIQPLIFYVLNLSCRREHISDSQSLIISLSEVIWGEVQHQRSLKTPVAIDWFNIKEDVIITRHNWLKSPLAVSQGIKSWSG